MNTLITYVHVHCGKSGQIQNQTANLQWKKKQPIVSNNCIYIKRTSQQACCVCWYIRSSLNVQTTRYLVDFV